MSIDAPDLFIENTPALQPLPCNRWIARSCFQKAIRRGDGAVAVRALANLFLHDTQAVWRHLMIVALEDVGVVNLDILKAIVKAKQEHIGRRTPGLLWSTFAHFAEQMASSNHDQAICDLLMRVENDTAVGDQLILEGSPQTWAAALYDKNSSMIAKATAALCFGGFVAVPFPADPEAVFEIMSDGSPDPEASTLSRSAWRISRNPMAMLLPIVWSIWRGQSETDLRDDDPLTTEWIGSVRAMKTLRSSAEKPFATASEP